MLLQVPPKKKFTNGECCKIAWRQWKKQHAVPSFERCSLPLEMSSSYYCCFPVAILEMSLGRRVGSLSQVIQYILLALCCKKIAETWRLTRQSRCKNKIPNWCSCVRGGLLILVIFPDKSFPYHLVFNSERKVKKEQAGRITNQKHYPKKLRKVL